METRLTGKFHEPYIKGPHVRYFAIALSVAFLLAAGSAFAILLFLNYAFPR